MTITIEVIQDNGIKRHYAQRIIQDYDMPKLDLTIKEIMAALDKGIEEFAESSTIPGTSEG